MRNKKITFSSKNTLNFLPLNVIFEENIERTHLMKITSNIIQNLILIAVAIVISVWIVKLKRGKIPLTDQVTRGLVEGIADTRLYTFFRGITELGSKTFVIPFVIIMMIILWITYKNII